MRLTPQCVATLNQLPDSRLQTLNNSLALLEVVVWQVEHELSYIDYTSKTHYINHVRQRGLGESGQMLGFYKL